MYFKLHPLLDSQHTDLNQITFIKQFTSNEFYLTDHLISDKKILPGVIYLEMVQAAARLAISDKKVRSISISWLKPIIATDTAIDILFANHDHIP